MDIKNFVHLPSKIYIKLRRRKFVNSFLHFDKSSGMGVLGFGDKCKVNGRMRISVGSDTWISEGVEILVYKPENSMPDSAALIFGNHVHVQPRCRITCAGNIKIGDYVLIAPEVFITDHNHGMTPTLSGGGYMNQPLIVKPVEIEDGVWLGQRVCVMPGVTIGAHSIIGAQSVVTHDIPAYCIAVGAPARVVKKYNFKTEMWERV